MSSHSEPSVETLTAEVRVLQVGSKPVTLSAARQLDYVGQSDIKPDTTPSHAGWRTLACGLTRIIQADRREPGYN